MMKKKKLFMVLAVAALVSAGTRGTAAYLTDYDEKINHVKAGSNYTEIKEEFPSVTPFPGDKDQEIPKKVWVTNNATGIRGESVDCYVRVSVAYSNSDIGKAVTLKNLNTTDWISDKDGYYYYRHILKEGQSTVPLFTGAYIESSKVEKEYLDKLDKFEIQIYEESTGTGDFKDYQSAWKHYS